MLIFTIYSDFADSIHLSLYKNKNKVHFVLENAMHLFLYNLKKINT